MYLQDAGYEKLWLWGHINLTADATFMFYNITLTAVISDKDFSFTFPS